VGIRCCPDGTFWLKVLNELRNRGVAHEDILMAVVDRLKGFPGAIPACYPQIIVQTCIVHLIRASPAFVSWKDRRAISGESSLENAAGQIG
jgi:transposase-like protein